MEIQIGDKVRWQTWYGKTEYGYVQDFVENRAVLRFEDEIGVHFREISIRNLKIS